MTGNRKLKGFYYTLGAMMLIILSAFVTGVKFQGGDIIAMLALIGSLGGAFFGANFGEHWAKSKGEKQ